MCITDLKRIEMRNIDGTNNVRYSAIIDGDKLAQYSTDGVFRKHLTLKEWEEYIRKNV